MALQCIPKAQHRMRPVVVPHEYLLSKGRKKSKEIKSFAWGLTVPALPRGLVISAGALCALG